MHHRREGRVLLKLPRSTDKDSDIRLCHDQRLVKGRQLEFMLAGKSGEIGIGDLLVPENQPPVGLAHIHIGGDEQVPSVGTDALQHSANLVNAEVSAQSLCDPQKPELRQRTCRKAIGLTHQPLLSGSVLKVIVKSQSQQHADIEQMPAHHSSSALSSSNVTGRPAFNLRKPVTGLVMTAVSQSVVRPSA